MKTYDVFLDYYDQIVRSINNPIEDEVEFLVEDCIKQYKPETKTILETACGTGVVAKELRKSGYKVIGLDISEKMLEKAEKLLNPPLTPPLNKGGGQKVELVLADMTDFDLGKTFDTVLCNYNSICHLLKWSQWQAFFDMAYKHLEKDGLFIFDINTVYEFENITREFAQFYNFGDDTVCLEMIKTSPPSPQLRSNFEDSRSSTPVSVILKGEGSQAGFIYQWLVKIFKKSDDGRYDLIQELVRENSFPISKIKKELKDKGFKILEMVDYHYGEVTAKSERVYFICKKK
ncbi:MAG: class I SAM-dependent methyltransferase [Candidatus Gracilibacteria bacterium]|nr:class I SAM-dependent methyltransferase [Candidatus Gracilibacteria bacterium]